MASSSSFSPVDMITPEVKYEVFLSFRGEDTRYNFISHLDAALRRKKIETFIDYRLNRGEEISPSLLDAIERSKISVVIFSKTYASSRWCLEELVKILECKNKYARIIIPIFYDVDPTNVRNQSGIFGDSFSELEDRFQGNVLQSWRLALREAANISGIVYKVDWPESELVEKVVEEIWKRLDVILPRDSIGKLVGAESSIRDIESSLLRIGLKDVYCLGIWGIGGIGKTTIARVVFSKISGHFDGFYFIENIREISEITGGLGHEGRKLRSAISEDENHDFTNFCNRRLNRKKVLIVFDDVSSPEQIELLIGGLDCLKPGSRVIITTRDKQVLTSRRVDEIYEVKELSEDAALKLFCRHAFGKDHPDVGYLELSNEILKYAKGVPLALKVLGGFLYRREKEAWESEISKLEQIPDLEIMKVLKVSYDGLNDKEKEIFLDIACFFKGESKDFVINFLDACSFYPIIGISVLVSKCLLVIRENMIMMHDLLQEMGREIVRQESIKDPGKRSRLFRHEDICNVLRKNSGTEAVEGISLNMSKVEEIHLDKRAFSKMHNLRFLKFYSYYYGENMNKIQIPQVLEFVLTELRYLEWHGCPLKSLSPNIRPENLVYLKMPNSSIQELWKGVQRLSNLKLIDLSGSEHLIKIPDLSLAKDLEILNFRSCTSLLETHSSIQYLNKLVILHLADCRSLESLHTSIHMESLEKLLLSGCSNLKILPELSCNIEVLYLGGTAIKELPSSVEHLSSLWILNLKNCSRLEALPSKICQLKNLKELYLSGCSNLERLPDELGNLEALEVLEAERIALREMPSSIICLTNLIKLCFESCNIIELPESLGQLSSLQTLRLGRNDFERIPESIINLSVLSHLDISYCERLQSLPELPRNLGALEAYCCSSLVALSGLAVFYTPRSLVSKSFDFRNCLKLDPNDVKEITEDSKLKLQLQATATYPEGVWYWKLPQSYICLPGSEIPEWFMFKNRMGSSINIKPTPDWFNNKFHGIAIIAVVGPRDLHHDHNDLILRVVFKSKLKTEARKDRVFHCFGNNRPHFDGVFHCFGNNRPHSDGSDHFVLGYDFGRPPSDWVEVCYGDDDAFFQFSIEEARNGKRAECCEVTKCGVHFFYAHEDIADAKEESSWSLRLSDDDDDDDGEEEPQAPPRKRFKNSAGPSQVAAPFL